MSDELLRRRELLRRAAWLLGGAVSAPAALAILEGCSAKDQPADWTPRFFKGAEAQVVTAIADVILPRTTTSGALDAGVPAFIDSVMLAVYPEEAQQRFHAGFTEFEAASRADGKAFLEQDAAGRAAAVTKALQAALAGNPDPRPFILMVRELTLLGYFSSRVGITENMEYVPVPGAYHGCVPVSKMNKPVYWE